MEEEFCRKKSRPAEVRISFALKQAETVTYVSEAIRKLSISEQTFSRWKKKYRGLDPSGLRKLKQL